MTTRPYYSRDGIELFHADNGRLIPQFEAGTIDCVITSPPYNLGGEPWPHLGNWKQGDSAGGKSKWRNGSDAATGIQYDGHRDAMPWNDYVAWQHSIISGLWDLLPGDGAIFYNHKPRVIGGKLWTPMELIPPASILRQIVIWSRPGGLNFNPTAFLPTHEWIMVLAKDMFRLKSRGASGLGDVWQMSPDKTPHPAPFPVLLPMRVLEAIPDRGRAVLDPFSGSGSTLVAAWRSGRKGIGIEASEKYCDMAATRLDKEINQGRLFPAPHTQSEMFADGDPMDVAGTLARLEAGR